LEIGPGVGELEDYLNEKGLRNIDIADNDQGVLDYVSSKYKVKNIYLINSTSSLDKKLKNYDLIVLIQVLEHLPNNTYAAALASLYKHLKPGGILIIAVPNAGNPLGLTERYGDLQHTISFTEQSLKDLLSVSGIENYEYRISGYEIPPYSLLNVARIILQKILHTFLLILMIINGGVFFRIMTPNIMMVISKK